MDLLEILSSVKSSGSGTGCSHYMQQCAARIVLDQQYGVADASFEMAVGTLVHKLMELHYDGKLVNTVLPMDDLANLETDPVQEALRVYSAYRAYFDTDEFEVLACELQIPETTECLACGGIGLTMLLSGPSATAPCSACFGSGRELSEQGKKQKAFLAKYLVDPFTFRPDMLVRFDSDQAERWNTSSYRAGSSVQPGIYLIDHKTHKKAESDVVRAYTMAPQVPIYSRLFNELCKAGLMTVNGEALPECQGLIINNIVRHSEMTPHATPRRAASFSSYVLEVGKDSDVAIYKQYFNDQKAYFATGKPNPSACRSFGRVCPHYETGRCDRVTPQVVSATLRGGGKADDRRRERALAQGPQ